MNRFYLILPAVLFSGLLLYGADPLAGTWVRNTELSKTKGTTTKSEVLTFDVTPDGIHATEVMTKTTGTVYRDTWLAAPDGKFVHIEGTVENGTGKLPFDSVSILKIDDHTYQVEWRNSATPARSSQRYVISADGKTLTVTSAGTPARDGSGPATYIYDKR